MIKARAIRIRRNRDARLDYVCLIRQMSPGFTLLELLLAISLLAMLSVLLLGGFHFGARAWERTGRAAEGGAELRLATSFLDSSLSRIYPSFDRSDPTHPHLNFVGEATEMRYLAPVPQALGAAGFTWIDLKLDRATADAGRLLVTVQPELETGDATPIEPSVLLDDVQGIRLTYYGALRHGEAPGWHEQWENARALPALIRIAVSFPVGDGRKWPDLVIAPLIDATALCDYGIRSQDCEGQ